MADDLDHLEFRPISRPVRDRKKPRRMVPRLVRHRSPSVHAKELERLADRAQDELAQQELPEGIEAKQIVELQAGIRIDERKLSTNGLTVLDSATPERVVAVSRDAEMSKVRERLARYAEAPDLPPREEDEGPDEGSKAFDEDVFDRLDGFERRKPEHRLTEHLQQALAEAEEGDRLHVVVDLYAPEDDELRQAWIDEVSLLSDRHRAEIDIFDDAAIGVTLIRLLADEALISDLSRLDQVASIDVPARPSLTAPRLAALQDLEALGPDVAGPDPNDPAIGIVDSGLQGGHVLLEGAVLGVDALHPAFDGHGEDEFGHGTMVAGLAVYGNVLACAERGVFAAPFPVASVRIFDSEGEIPEGANPEGMLRDAIEHLVEQYDCRVVCLSLGDHNDPFLGGRASALAALIDDLSRALDVVLIVPTGNVQHETLAAPAQLLDSWPAYLKEPGNELLSPSQGALAITVGAIAERDATDLEDASAAPAAAAGGPAPYARRGPGVRGARKPEVVADGGNWIYDRGDGSILDDAATSVVSLSARPDLLFDTAIGSSFAAGQVAHVANQVARRYPDLSAAAIRALLLQGTVPVQPPDGFDETEAAALLGAGIPDLERCSRSSDSRTVLLSEATLRPDGFHVYRLPSNTDFMSVSGTRHVTTALSFDPPVRYRRYDYLAYQMDAFVVRGVSEDEVFHLASSDNDGKLSELSKKSPSMRPTVTSNGRAVNQLARVTYKKLPAEKFRQDWFVVVRSLNRWMRDRSPQPYSLAVALEVEGSNRLYSQLRAEVEVRTRLRARRG